MADATDPTGELVATSVSARVSFDVSVHIRKGCPLTYSVDETATTLYIGEIQTSAFIAFADQALLTLADVTTRAVTALLSARTPSHDTDSRPVADPPDAMSPHPPVWINPGITVADGCPISFVLYSDCLAIVVQDTDTLILTFWPAVFLEFARLVSEAAGDMLNTRKGS